MSAKIALTLGLGALVTFTEPAAAAQPQMVFFTPTESFAIVSELADILARKCALQDISFRVESADMSEQTQNAEIVDLPPGSVCLVWPVSGSQISTITKMAQDQDSLLIFLDIPASSETLAAYDKVWSVSCDKDELGQRQSELIVEYLQQHPNYDRNGNGTLDIALVRGLDGHPNSVTRTEAVKKGLTAAGIRFQIIDDYSANWYFAPAMGHMKSLIALGRLPDIEMIVSNNDDMALGYQSAIASSSAFEEGRIDMPPAFGVDGIPEARGAIRRGEFATVRMDLDTIAAAVTALVSGGEAALSKVPGLRAEGRRIYVPGLPMTQETVRSRQSRP